MESNGLSQGSYNSKGNRKSFNALQNQEAEKELEMRILFMITIIICSSISIYFSVCSIFINNQTIAILEDKTIPELPWWVAR